MPDEIDSANTVAELFLLASSSKRLPTSKLTPMGYCLCESCALEFDKSDPDWDKKLFCDSACARQYEKEKSGG
jgi:hypothetical protein